MGITVQDLLSGNIVQPRQQPAQDTNSGLGQMLQFLMQSSNQPVAQVPESKAPSLSELATISAARRKEREQADAVEQRKKLFGTLPVGANGIHAPLLGANYGTGGSGVLGGKVSMNQALQEMMASSDPDIAQQALATYSNLNKPRSENDNAPSGYVRNVDGTLRPMMIKGINGVDNYFDVQQSNNRIPGYGETEKLQIAQDSNTRAQASEKRSVEREQNLIEKTDRANALQEWRLQNPNYEKNQQSIQDAEAEFAKLRDGIYAYAGTPPDEQGKNGKPGIIDNYDQMDRHNPFKNGELQAEYQSMTWPLRSESMINTGVLNPGDLHAVNATSQDPTDFGLEGWRSNEDIKKQQWEVLKIAERNVKALRKSKAPTSPPPFIQQQPQTYQDSSILSPQDYLKKHGGGQ